LLPVESHVARSEQYVAGDARYDAYFEHVYAEQKAAQAWTSERRSARRSLVQLFSFADGASDDVIVGAVRERAKATPSAGYKLDAAAGKVTPVAVAKPDTELVRAVEECVKAEQQRIKRMAQKSTELAELAKEADGLLPVVPTRFRPDGNAKVDEVKVELRAAHKSLKDLSVAAKKEERAGEDLFAALGRALLPSAQSHAASHPLPPGPAGTATSKPKGTTDLPPPKPPTKTDPLPPPKPPEPPKPPGTQEEFAP
jgi:hypothetical protein